ncbi:MAG: DNA-processing protein DprA [Fimbriimonadaceae bacterium]
MMSAEETEFWQRLLAAELNPSKCRELLRSLGTFSIDAVRQSRLLSSAERERFDTANIPALNQALEKGARMVLPNEYPPLLQTVELVPPALFIDGDWSCLSEPTVAIVGTRNASTYGKAVSQKFASAIASAGVTIVSGGALGIDAAAHRGALEVGGKTAAVMITGIDGSYPREHEALFRQIKKEGCLISQFSVGAKKLAWDTRPLARNQTIAALSQALLVIEAPFRSGALSTAHAANDLGRQIFVVPSNIDNLNFKGSHSLIRDGATLVDHPDQLLEAIGIRPAERKANPIDVSDSQKLVLSVLSTTPIPSEFIVERTGLDTAQVMSELTLLELEGLVIRDAGGFACMP